MRIKRWASAVAMFAAISISIPAAANPRDAAFATSGDRVESRAHLFSGATLRLGLDGRRDRKPELALRVAGATHERGVGSRIGEGLAIGTAADGQARLSIAGQDSKIVGRRLGLSKGATVAIVVGAVVVVGLLVIVASSNMVPDDFLDEG